MRSSAVTARSRPSPISKHDVPAADRMHDTLPCANSHSLRDLRRHKGRRVTKEHTEAP